MACSEVLDSHFEAFLAYSSADEDKVVPLWHALKRKGYRITIDKDYDDFRPGHSAFENMTQAVENSDKTLVYLTENAINSGFVCLEIMLALEKTQRTGRVSLCLLTQFLQEREISSLKRGLLACISDINIETNRLNWEDRLISTLKEERLFHDLLPLGNLAHGQAFSHYCGYLQHILPVLKTEIRNHHLYQQHPDEMCLSYFMLIPFNCDTEIPLQGLDKKTGINIEYVSELLIEIQYAAKQRKYNPAIYKATKGRQTIYFICEFPKVLYTVFSIQAMGIASVDCRLEAQRFYHTMNHLLNHRHNPKCNNKCTLLPYADDKFTCAEVLWKALTEELKRPTFQTENSISEESDLTVLQFSDTEGTKYVASVSCLSDETTDRAIAEDLAKFLEDNKKPVVRREYKRGKLPELDDARWNIFIISKNSFGVGDNVLDIELASALCRCGDNKHIQMIPVVNGMKIDDVPKSLKWATMLGTEQENYKEIILRQIEGKVVHIQEQMPAGDVSTGLSWAYLMNYIPLQLRGKTVNDRVQNLLKDEATNCGCLPYFYVILSSNGTNVEQKGGPVEYIGKSEPVVIQQAGTKNRTYYMHMYKYTFEETGKTVCYISEVCTPGVTLNTMATKMQFAGIQEGEILSKQVRNLASGIEGRLHESNYKEKVGDFTGVFRLIRYDVNGKETLHSVIGRHLGEDLQTAELIYGEDPMDMLD